MTSLMLWTGTALIVAAVLIRGMLSRPRNTVIGSQFSAKRPERDP